MNYKRKELTGHEMLEVLCTVRASVIARYGGDLTRHDATDYDGEAVWYTPNDEDHVRGILRDLWGDWLTGEKLEEVAKRAFQADEYWS
jgi:hypothetical protein